MVIKHTSHGTFSSVLYYVAFCHPPPLKAPRPRPLSELLSISACLQVPSTSPPRFCTFGRNSTHIFRFNRQFLVTKHTSHGTFFSVLYYVAFCHLLKAPPGPDLSLSSSTSQLVSQAPQYLPYTLLHFWSKLNTYFQI